jgi:hypothetical protein
MGSSRDPSLFADLDDADPQDELLDDAEPAAAG